MSLEYNHQAFIAAFERHLDSLGFYLKKDFDDTEKGGRFFEIGARKNKAKGKYRYLPSHESYSGKPVIIYTFFEVWDKATNKVVSGSRTECFKDTSSSNSKNTTAFDKAEYERKKVERDAYQALLQKNLSKKAFEEYKTLKDVNADPNNHQYIKRKNVAAARGLIIAKENMKIGSYYNIHKTDPNQHDYYYIAKGDLLVPAIDLDLQFRTYQKIDPYGRKRQRIDISTVGAFYCLGEWRENTVRIYLVEGYATGYTLHRAMDSAVVFVCFDVQNIGVVAAQLRERYPFIEIIICTDNDRKKSTKVGLYKGFEYAYRFDQPFIFPKFDEGPEYDDLSDWNDLATVLLDSEIKEMVEKQISFFKEYGTEKCIKWVAKSNGLSEGDLIEYAEHSRIKDLFSSLDLSIL